MRGEREHAWTPSVVRLALRWVWSLAALAGAGAGACGDGDSPPAVPPTWAIDADGARLHADPDALALRPRAFVDGAWRGAGADGPCAVEDGRLSCPAGPGAVQVWADDGALESAYVASGPATVEALELSGEAVVPGARGWVSNGYQSWSQSGVLALGDAVPEAALAEALAARGDAEVLRTGEAMSWAWTAVGGGGSTLVAGAVTARRLEPWVQVWRGADGRVALRMVCGATGERVTLAAGDELRGERWVVALDTEEEAALRSYAYALPSRLAAHPVAAEAGWNSWYELWDRVDPEAVMANARLAREVLAPVLPVGTPPLRVVIDDGWQRAWGDWWPAEHFPRGVAGVAQDLAAEGFTAGIWLAPLLVAEQSPVAVEHPEWLVEGAVYRHLSDGTMRILDPTHPGAAAHLRETIARIVGWGFGLLKIDFLFAGAMDGGRYEDVTALEAYGRALSIIREAAGPDTVLLAVGAPGLASLPYAEAWRVGPDIAVEPFGPSFAFVANELRSVGARWPFCVATLCDADPPLLRELAPDAVDLGAWAVGLSGGALFLSDDLRALPEARRLRGVPAGAAAAALSGQPSVPETLFGGDLPSTLSSALADHIGGEHSQVVPVVWRLPDGRRVAFNVGAEPLTVEGATVPAEAARVLP
ncbi:MAG: alpha-galactosidase [Deltaproteobacteria bacterium]|nr:alpha-galactosidase [Deltaproteobacteria bacterium]